MTAKLVKNGQDEVVILTGIQTSHHLAQRPRRSAAQHLAPETVVRPYTDRSFAVLPRRRQTPSAYSSGSASGRSFRRVASGAAHAGPGDVRTHV